MRETRGQRPFSLDDALRRWHRNPLSQEDQQDLLPGLIEIALEDLDESDEEVGIRQIN